MSEQLKRSAMDALKKAYQGYMNRDWAVYTGSLHDARTNIDVIRGLGHDPDRMGRELEVLYLTGEELLISAFTFLGKPWEMRMYYELAAYYLTVFPSGILKKDAEYLPPDVDLLEIFPLPEGNANDAMDEFAKAMDIYAKLTGGGGGGVDKLYRAAIACQRGDASRARLYTELARKEGGAWILPHADSLERQIERKCGQDQK